MTLFVLTNKETNHPIFMDDRNENDSSLLYAFGLKDDAEVFRKEVFKNDSSIKIEKMELRKARNRHRKK